MASWPKFLLAMTPVVLDVLRDLYRLTGGDVTASKVAVRRIRNQGYVLQEVEAEVDAEIDAMRLDTRERSTSASPHRPPKPEPGGKA